MPLSFHCHPQGPDPEEQEPPEVTTEQDSDWEPDLDEDWPTHLESQAEARPEPVRARATDRQPPSTAAQWADLQLRLGEMATAIMGWIEDIQGFAQHYQAQLRASRPAGLANRPAPEPDLGGVDDADYLVLGELGCLVKDRLIPTYCDCYELHSRGPGASQGYQMDPEALWDRLRPEKT